MFRFLSSIPENHSEKSKCIIMLHGVGSNEQDLFSLASNFGKDNYIFSLGAPVELGVDRYAWYRVDFSTGKPLYKKEDVEAAYEYIASFISEVIEKYSLQPEQIYLLGFSQGAIISYYTLWRLPENIGGIIALSGRILDEIDTSDVHKQIYQGKRIFIGHGTEDQMIGVGESEGARDFSRTLGIEPTYKIYSAPHAITKEEIVDIQKWIS